MAKNQQRLSQLITTFGPGSMVDLPTRSVMIGGLERWDMRDTKSWQSIDEDRLVILLEKKLKENERLAQDIKLSLRTPPVANDMNGHGLSPGIEVIVFPTWFVNGKVEHFQGSGKERRRRRLVKWTELDAERGRQQYVDDDGKRNEVTPIRFVGACEKGHIQDIDWRWVIHKGEKCHEPMWFEEHGTSADPADTRIVCDCKKFISLEQAFAPGRLGKCSGQRPWLGHDAKEECQHELRLLTRSATNAYFPQVVTVISLPAAEDQLAQILEEYSSTLKTVNSIEDIALAKRFNDGFSEVTKAWGDDEIFSSFQKKKQHGEANTELPSKYAEFDVFASGHDQIGENRSDAKLYAQTLKREDWDLNEEIDLSFIKNLVKVHRLREVMCLYGFTRFEAAPTAADGNLEDIVLSVNGASLSQGTDWLPAIEQFGEGLFLHIDEQKIADWLDGDHVKERKKQLVKGYQNWAESRDPSQMTDFPGLPYVLLHSLSHVLMNEISLDCGYPASALKERIYALPDPVTKQVGVKCGILIYTATTGSQGTLGGLVDTVPRLGKILDTALEKLLICSNDPVCSDHKPADRDDDRALVGAACHGCLLVAETSCENRNTYLDRALLVDTMGEAEAAFLKSKKLANI